MRLLTLFDRLQKQHSRFESIVFLILFPTSQKDGSILNFRWNSYHSRRFTETSFGPKAGLAVDLHLNCARKGKSNGQRIEPVPECQKRELFHHGRSEVPAIAFLAGKGSEDIFNFILVAIRAGYFCRLSVQFR